MDFSQLSQNMQDIERGITEIKDEMNWIVNLAIVIVLIAAKTLGVQGYQAVATHIRRKRKDENGMTLWTTIPPESMKFNKQRMQELAQKAIFQEQEEEIKQQTDSSPAKNIERKSSSELKDRTHNLIREPGSEQAIKNSRFNDQFNN